MVRLLNTILNVAMLLFVAGWAYGKVSAAPLPTVTITAVVNLVEDRFQFGRHFGMVATPDTDLFKYLTTLNGQRVRITIDPLDPQ